MMKQNKGSVIGGCMGIVFVLLGITVIIPRAGIIGVIWTLFAIVIAGGNLYPVLDRLCAPALREEENFAAADGADVQPQLDQLRRYLDAGLITKQEYEEKREEILRGL